MSELTKEQRNRVEGARDAIDAVLENFKVDLVPAMTIISGQIISHSIGITPRKEDNRIIVPKVDTSKLNIQGGKNG